MRAITNLLLAAAVCILACACSGDTSTPMPATASGGAGASVPSSASGTGGTSPGAAGASGAAAAGGMTPSAAGRTAPASAGTAAPAAGSNAGSGGAPATMTAGGPATMPTAGTTATPTAGGAAMPMTGDPGKYKDPGTGEWQKGTPEECKMDPTKFADSPVNNYAVFRYGKMCHIKGADSVGMMYSATKTLGGTTAGRCAWLAKDIMKSGAGTGPIVPEDSARDWIPNAREGATISHVMSMVAAASSSLDYESLTWRYDTVGSEAINGMIQATEKCAGQLMGSPKDFVQFMQKEVFDKLGMKNSSYTTSLGIASGWSANLSDMGKLGTLLLHDGWYNGERLVSPVWVYRMSHPNFESANTSYGHLAWLNHRGNAEGIGGNITTGSNAAMGDPCAPACFWRKYPHYQSKAKDCMAEVGTCEQKYDVGIWSAQGANGQFVVMHPGLDLVIVAKNFSGGDGPLGLWRAIRPGVVAMDPMFKGDEMAFCKAYGDGNYAPDMLVERDDGL